MYCEVQMTKWKVLYQTALFRIVPNFAAALNALHGTEMRLPLQ
jgi:hypothetical protein